MNPFVSPRWENVSQQSYLGESLSEPTPTPTPAGPRRRQPGEKKPPRNLPGPAGAGGALGRAGAAPFICKERKRGMGKETETDPTSFSEM